MINELVERLSTGSHEVVIGYRGEKGKEIKRNVESGYVHIKFIQTRGGTELGVNIDLDNMSSKEVDFDQERGVLHLEGFANLNYNLVRCIADIDLTTRTGEGTLKVIKE